MWIGYVEKGVVKVLLELWKPLPNECVQSKRKANIITKKNGGGGGGGEIFGLGGGGALNIKRRKIFERKFQI